MKRVTNLLGVVVLVMVGACKPHVTLSAPPKAAPLNERVQALKNLHAGGMQQTHTTHFKDSTGASMQTNYLQLDNGKRIYHPEDLLAVVGNDTPAGIAALEYQSTMKIAKPLASIGYGLGMGGLLLTPIMMLEDPVPKNELLTLAAVSITGFIGLFVGMAMAQSTLDNKTTAFVTYNKSLMSNLGLCEQDGQLEDCASESK